MGHCAPEAGRHPHHAHKDIVVTFLTGKLILEVAHEKHCGMRLLQIANGRLHLHKELLAIGLCSAAEQNTRACEGAASLWPLLLGHLALSAHAD